MNTVEHADKPWMMADSIILDLREVVYAVYDEGMIKFVLRGISAVNALSAGKDVWENFKNALKEDIEKRHSNP